MHMHMHMHIHMHMHMHAHTYAHAHAHAHTHTQPFPYAGQAVFILTLPYRWWFSGMTAKIRGSVVKEISSISNYVVTETE